MSYRFADFAGNSVGQSISRIAEIADCAWRGYSSHDLKWRKEYYESIFGDFTTSKKYLALIEYEDERLNTIEDCAFLIIYPMSRQVFNLHLTGAVSQYDFTIDIFDRITRKNQYSIHYIQSVYRDPRHSSSHALRVKIRDAFERLLKGQYCGFNNRDFIIYAETGIQVGQKLALSQGLKQTGRNSKEGHPIFCFDSRRDRGELEEKILKLWTDN
jgi:hypothetical protein